MRILEFLLLFSLNALFYACLAKPAEKLSNPGSLNPVQLMEVVSVDADQNREQRSPQFGLLGEDYSDYSEEEEERTFDHHRKHKHHKHKPEGFHGHPTGHYGGYQPPEHYYPPSTGGGGSFATASAGSIDSHGKPFGGQSHANAQTASFSFGPYSATFSVAEAASGSQRY
nr:uncharacterized protein LOC117600456 [Osmia lignaria]